MSILATLQKLKNLIKVNILPTLKSQIKIIHQKLKNLVIQGQKQSLMKIPRLPKAQTLIQAKLSLLK